MKVEPLKRKQEKYNLISDFIILQGITLFQSIADPMADIYFS